MAESKKNMLSDMLSTSRESFLNTMEVFGKAQKQLETIFSNIFTKGSSAQDTINKMIRGWLDTTQSMTQDFTAEFNKFLDQGIEYFQKLGDFPYKNELEGLVKRLADESKETLSWLKVYKIKS